MSRSVPQTLNLLPNQNTNSFLNSFVISPSSLKAPIPLTSLSKRTCGPVGFRSKIPYIVRSIICKARVRKVASGLVASGSTLNSSSTSKQSIQPKNSMGIKRKWPTHFKTSSPTSSKSSIATFIVLNLASTTSSLTTARNPNLGENTPVASLIYIIIWKRKETRF